MPRLLKSYKVLIFDVYGTIVDWESGIYSALLPILPPSWSREDALLAYTYVEKDLQARYPEMLYRDLLAKAHEILCSRLATLDEDEEHEPGEDTQTMKQGIVQGELGAEGMTVDRRHVEFADSIKSWPIFPDSVPALRALSKNFKLVVLSNVDHQSFGATHTQLAFPGGESPFTLVLTAQDTGAYKPYLTGLQYALSQFATSPQFSGITRDEVLVVAQSLYHDHVPANQLGLDNVWIDREGAVMGVEPDVKENARWGWRFTTLGKMADEVEREAKQSK